MRTRYTLTSYLVHFRTVPGTLFLLLFLSVGPVFPDESEFAVQFLEKYCLECHDSDIQKGDRNFEDFFPPLKSVHDLESARDILYQVSLREMPPVKADQPTDEEREKLIQSLHGTLIASHGKVSNKEARTVMRRLSNREYENTLETLFGRSLATLGLTVDFPKENTSEHMDNIGETLVTSGFLLDQYFQAANRLVEMRLGKPNTEANTWHFTDNFKQYEELSGAHRKVFNNEFLCVYEQPDTDTRQGSYGHIEKFLEGVPVSGLYDIEILVKAMHRDTHYDPEIFGMDFSEPFQVGIVPGDYRKGHIHYPQKVEPVLAKTTVPDDDFVWKKFRVWLEKDQTPRFIFPNGAYESRASIQKVNAKYKDELQKNGEKPPYGTERTLILKYGKLPHIRIDEVKIHGPVVEPDGGKEEFAVFGKGGFQEAKAIDQLYAFGERAFRRPLNDTDRRRIKNLYQRRIVEKATPRQAALDTVKMILCSPSFLYLAEATPETEKYLRPYDLASRLSYALWAAPPDNKLLSAAATGKIDLKQQTLRMLKDPKSDGFVEAFPDSWLNLREIGNQPPPRKSAQSYYAENLPVSMKQEARLLFRELLDNNGPVTDFLGADYTFVDKKLAKLYDLPEKDTLKLADGFQRVSLKGNAQRGGLLGMAGVLTVSANGVDTSPVTRGVWVMENVLGITPPPPPDEVPEIESDVRGATTIRERLEKHAADNSCKECHRKIDPLGFALETYDPIGRWRTTYPRKVPKGRAMKIDSTGEFPSGETYSGFAGFRDYIAANRKDVFTRGLIEKMLTYATGRHMTGTDYPEMEMIYDKVSKDNYGLRTLVVEVMASDIFRSR